MLVVCLMSTAMALEKIGRYEIVGQLGKGAMGIVYKAMDPTIGHTFALKTMRLDVQGLETSELLQRFRNEARLAGVLSHPNIVSIYDADEINGLFYMAMEYIEGKTLHQLLSQEHVLPIERVLDLSRQICAGLDAASAQRVVHRDIKPANVMILPIGTLKIMDFGIAKAGGSMTSTGEVLGTPNYMSPEQVKGHLLDGRSDLFSFAVILYEMVTGAKPIVGDNIATILYKIVNERPTPPRELNPAIHPGLDRVLLKALSKSPQQRYQLGADLVHALENYESTSGTENASRTLAATAPNVPQQSVAATPMKVAPSRQARDNAPTFGASAKSAVAKRKPLAARKSISLLPVVAGFLAVLIVVASGAIVYIKHRQTKQSVERESQLQQTKSETAEKTPTSFPPETTAAATPLPSSIPLAEASSSESIPSPSEPTPSAVTSLAELVVSTDPDGAEVKIDGRGQSDWRTPFTAAAVPPGPHTVTFSKSGYAGETRVVEVHTGQQAFLRVSMKVMTPTATASIGSDPVGAAILVDGKEIAQVTPAQVVLSRGVHNIALRKAGFQEAATDVDLQESQIYSFAPALKPLDSAKAKDTHPNFFARLFGGGGDKVPVEMQTTPRGAEILVNGTPYSKTTPAKIVLPPG